MAHGAASSGCVLLLCLVNDFNAADQRIIYICLKSQHYLVIGCRDLKILRVSHILAVDSGENVEVGQQSLLVSNSLVGGEGYR